MYNIHCTFIRRTPYIGISADVLAHFAELWCIWRIQITAVLLQTPTVSRTPPSLAPERLFPDCTSHLQYIFLHFTIEDLLWFTAIPMVCMEHYSRVCVEITREFVLGTRGNSDWNHAYGHRRIFWFPVPRRLPTLPWKRLLSGVWSIPCNLLRAYTEKLCSSALQGSHTGVPEVNSSLYAPYGSALLLFKPIRCHFGVPEITFPVCAPQRFKLPIAFPIFLSPTVWYALT